MASEEHIGTSVECLACKKIFLVSTPTKYKNKMYLEITPKKTALILSVLLAIFIAGLFAALTIRLGHPEAKMGAVTLIVSALLIRYVSNLDNNFRLIQIPINLNYIFLSLLIIIIFGFLSFIGYQHYLQEKSNDAYVLPGKIGVEMNPNASWAWHRLANLNEIVARDREAEEAERKAISLGDEDPCRKSYIKSLVEILLREKKYEEAKILQKEYAK